MPDETTESAWRLIGAYFCHFSELEARLNEALAVAFNLDDQQGNPIAGSLDFMKKVDLVGSAIAKQSNDEAWKKQSESTLNKVAGANSTRVKFAHSELLPQPNGSVRLVWWRARDRKRSDIDEVWTTPEFKSEFDLLAGLSREVKAIATALKPVVITPFGWQNNSWEVAAQIAGWRQKHNVAAHSGMHSSETPLVLRLDAEERKKKKKKT